MRIQQLRPRHVALTLALAVSLLACACNGTGGATQDRASTESGVTAEDAGSVHNKTRSNVSPELWTLLEDFEAHNASGTSVVFQPTSSKLRVRSGRVAIDCAAANDATQLAADLNALGMTDTAIFGAMVGGWLPIESLAGLEDLDSLRFARAAMATTRR